MVTVNEQLMVDCKHCGAELLPHGFNTIGDDIRFVDWKLIGCVDTRCPECGTHNFVSFEIRDVSFMGVS
jgi:predicted nucleic-acid-binding Zn-ribbon protein